MVENYEEHSGDVYDDCLIKLRVNPKRRRDKVYVGCGAGFSGDRPMAAFKLLQSVNELNYIVLEFLAERTLADRYKEMIYGGDGYDPRISEWMHLLLPLAVERGTCRITNMGAMDPIGAQIKVLEIANSLGLSITVVVAHEVAFKDLGSASSHNVFCHGWCKKLKALRYYRRVGIFILIGKKLSLWYILAYSIFLVIEGY